MNDSSAGELVLQLLASLFWIAVIYGIYRWLFPRPSRLRGLPAALHANHVVAPLPPQEYARTVTAVLEDPCDHPYDNLSLDNLSSHIRAKHLEVWNMLGPRNPTPDGWRMEHALDHGLMLR